MADSSEPAFLFLYRKGAVAPVDYLSTFATAPEALNPVTRSVTNKCLQHKKRPFSERLLIYNIIS